MAGASSESNPIHDLMIDDLLSNGGELGAHIRRFDWSATALGPLTLWPQSLISALSICLACPEPMALYWGPQLIILPNDAFRVILGSKYPDCLGLPAQQVFPELWHLIRDDFMRVMEQDARYAISTSSCPCSATAMSRRGISTTASVRYGEKAVTSAAPS